MTAPGQPSPTLPHARGAARRAVVRWAVRLFRREWRQQVLVLALLGVAVATTVVGIALAASSLPSQAAEFGRARQILELDGTAERFAENLAAVRSAFGAAEAVRHATITAPGAVDSLDVRDQDPAGALGSPMLRLRSGRFPAAPGEVALTDGAAAPFGVGVGDEIPIDGAARTAVGVVENPLRLSDEFVLVAPGSLGRTARVAVLVDVADGAVRGFRLPDGSGLTRKSYSKLAASQAAAVVLAIATVGMLFVGMLAAAGFAVMAQRRLRALGMLGAIGATDRQVRSVLLASGAVTGAAAAVAGVGAGLGAWSALAGRLERLVDHRIDRFDLPWWSVGATVALAVGTAVAAAWWPARTAARTSVVASLSGRPPAPRPARGFALLGVASVGAGVALLFVSQQRGTVAILVGTAATMIGVLLLAPLAVRALGALAPRMPVPARLALRDLVRYRARSGAAVGAAALALGIAAVVSISAAAAAADDRASGVLGNLPVGELVVHVGSGQGLEGGPVTNVSAEQLARARAAVAEIAEVAGAVSTVELSAAVDPDAPVVSVGAAAGPMPAALVEPVRESGRLTGYRWRAALYVATPDVLRYVGIDVSAVGTAEVVTARRDLGAVELSAPARPAEGGVRQSSHPPTSALVDVPAYTSEPTTLITESAVATMGLRPMTAGWAVRGTRALTASELTATLRTAAAAGLSVETPHDGPSYGRLRASATAAGLLVALGVLAMTVGLIRSETAGDARVLAAVGASSHMRRSMVAVTAAALGFVGGVLGTAGAYAALLAWHHRDLSSLRDVPLADLAATVFGLPVLAALGGWLLSRSEPSSTARSALT